jgi:hypothetical protein
MEVMVSATILGVVAMGYAAMYTAQLAQRDAVEEVTIAMEMASRQIEFLRSADPTLSEASPDGPPFTSHFQTTQPFPAGCIPVPYGAVGGTALEAGRPAGYRIGEGEFLTAANSFRFPDGGRWVVGQSAGTTPPALFLPAELAAKGYSVVVRAARVRTFFPGAGGSSEGVFENLLLHYQVEVYRGAPGAAPGTGRLLLMVPYLKAVNIP